MGVGGIEANEHDCELDNDLEQNETNNEFENNAEEFSITMAKIYRQMQDIMSNKCNRYSKELIYEKKDATNCVSSPIPIPKCTDKSSNPYVFYK
jgi:hypothetical protein